MALTCIKWWHAVCCVAWIAANAAPARGDPLSDLASAHEAAQHGQLRALESWRQRHPGHLLDAYATYWTMAGSVDRRDPADIRAFLARNADTPLADSLRREWLRVLGAAGNWETFRAEQPLLVADDADIACSKPEEAADRLSLLAPRLGTEATRQAWAQVALQAALAHHALALEWYGLAGDTVLTDSQAAWKVRAALRTQSWKEVLAAIQQ